jgi:hypothetical protein
MMRNPLQQKDRRRSCVNALGALTIANTLLAKSQQPSGLRTSGGLAAPAFPAAVVNAHSWPGIDDGNSIYSVKHVTSAKLKIDLYQRVGKAFDLDIEKFADAGKMAQKIQAELAKMPPSQVFALEKSLGLDELGVSLREVLDAMTDPTSDGGRKLDASLKGQAGETDADSAKLPGRGLDEIGRYSPASVAH